MTYRLFLSLLITTLFLMTTGLRAQTYDKETDYWLQQLDEELLKRDVYIQQKQEKIDLLNAQRKQLKQDEERFFQNRQVYDECMTFDSDLAMEIVDENIGIARRMHDREWETEWQIKDYVSSSLHADGHVHSNGTQVTKEVYCKGAEGEFHIYGMEWTADYFQFYDEASHSWKAEPGKFNLLIGTSSQDIVKTVVYEL